MNFREQVYFLAKQIPKGKVATYGQLAKLANRPRAARAVGMFMRTNPFAPVVPCHRVVASTGALTGFFGKQRKLDQKRHLLEAEGVIFKGENVDLHQCLWDNQ